MVMKHIAITAGGTSENMDGVRKLTNVSTGRLGWECLEAVLRFFESNSNDFHIYYIHTENAFRGVLDAGAQQKIDFIGVTDAQSVYDAVDGLTRRVSVTHFIHAMAVSDFTFDFALSPQQLAQEIYNRMSEEELSVDDLRRIILNPEGSYPPNFKISSQEPLLIGLKTTRKVIALIKKNNPHTFLVGFKLLRNVDESDLMREAQRLAGVNGCDLVFANELSQIAGSNHAGILVKGGAIVARPKGKTAIAQTIVEKMME